VVPVGAVAFAFEHELAVEVGPLADAETAVFGELRPISLYGRLGFDRKTLLRH